MEDRFVIDATGLLVSIGLVFLAGLSGVVCRPGPWYRALRKPVWTPDDSFFAPAWTALYLSIAIAAWLVWRDGTVRELRVPLSLYLLHLVLNAHWPYVFFVRNALTWALVESVSIAAIVVGCALTFYVVNPLGGLLVVPYVAWTTYVAVLNFGFWSLNPDERSRRARRRAAARE